MDSEYEALMAELGTGKPKGPLGQDPQKSRTENLASQPAQNINRVGHLIEKTADSEIGNFSLIETLVHHHNITVVHQVVSMEAHQEAVEVVAWLHLTNFINNVNNNRLVIIPL